MELRSTIRSAYALLITVIVIILLVARGCGPNNILGTGRTVIDTDTVTLYIKGKDRIIHDTTEKVVYKDRDFHHYHTDTLWKQGTKDWNVGYFYEKQDTLLNATIGVWAKEKPDSISFEYKASIPTVYRIDTIVNNIKEVERVSQLYLGPEAIVYPGFKGGFVTADFISSRGWQLEAGIGYGDFGTGFNPMGKVGFKKVISLRKKK